MFPIKNNTITNLEELFLQLPFGFIVIDLYSQSFYPNIYAQDIIKERRISGIESLLEFLEIKTDLNSKLNSQQNQQHNLIKKINGSVYLIVVYIHPDTNLFPSFMTVTLFNLDVIRTNEVLESIKRFNKEIESIIESTYDGIILSDKEGRIYRANKSIERLTGGIKAEDIIGKTAQELEEEGFILSQTKKILGKNPLMLTQKLKTGVEIFITSTRVFNDSGNVIFNVENIRNIDELKKLKKQVEEAVDLSQKYYTELQELRERFMETESIIMKSTRMKQITETLIKASKSSAPILITGESGVGKEIAAKIAHKASNRKDGPFVEINCGAIPENLLESELFGYETGAFTGAQKNGKKGLMEVASGGSLFLDEVAELPIELQVKLLRTLEEQQIYRLGGINKINIDIRIIAASNRNLEKLVEQGKFRKDLYYRLNVLPIHIPPLRERKEDILPLSYHFLQSFNNKYNKSKTFSLEVCSLLEEYSWPGNVRELENLIERLVIISEEDRITQKHLPAEIKQARTIIDPTLLQDQPISLKNAMEYYEKIHIKNVVDSFECKREASKALGIDYSTLFRKMKKYNLV